MLIADAQVHIWGADTPQRPWRKGPRNEAHRPQPFTVTDVLREMDAARVQRVILVPPSMEGDRNDLVLDAARMHPQRLAVMGRIPVEGPPLTGVLADWRQQPGMLGLRLTFRQQSFRALLEDDHCEWLWIDAERHGVPIMLMVDYDQLDLIERVVARHAGLRLILDHLCLSAGLNDDAAFAGLARLLALAKYPNVAVKVSALPCYTADAWPYRRLHPYLRRIHDAYGPRRMCWGSDLTRLPCTYRDAVTMFTEHMPWLSAGDLEWIMGRSVCAWTGWPLPANH